MAALHQQRIIKAPTPTWLLIRATPPPRDVGGATTKKHAASAACSPLILSPSVWEKALSEGKDRADGGRDAAGRGGGLPASPRISCMGQVKGRRRRGRCSPSARGPAAVTGPRYGGAGGKVARFVLGLFGRRSGRTASRACARVMDVPNGSASASGSSRGGGGGGGGAAAVAVLGVLDPPLPVVRRPVRVDGAPSLWERRRGGKALEGLRLTLHY